MFLHIFGFKFITSCYHWMMVVIRNLLCPKLLFCSAVNATAINPPSKHTGGEHSSAGDRDSLGIIYNCKDMLRAGETSGSCLLFILQGRRMDRGSWCWLAYLSCCLHWIPSIFWHRGTGFGVNFISLQKSWAVGGMQALVPPCRDWEQFAPKQWRKKKKKQYQRSWHSCLLSYRSLKKLQEWCSASFLVI